MPLPPAPPLPPPPAPPEIVPELTRLTIVPPEFSTALPPLPPAPDDPAAPPVPVIVPALFMSKEPPKSLSIVRAAVPLVPPSVTPLEMLSTLGVPEAHRVALNWAFAETLLALPVIPATMDLLGNAPNPKTLYPNPDI